MNPRGSLPLVALAALAAGPRCAPPGPPPDARTEDQRLPAPDLAVGDIFGAACAVDGDVAVVAAEYDDDAGRDAGAVRVFGRDGEGWVARGELRARDATAGDNFGRAVALAGDALVVGAHWADTARGPRAGAAYVFHRRAGAWEEAQKLTAPDGGPAACFGVAVSVGDGRLAVSAWRDDARGADSGSVYVWRRDGERWVPDRKLAPDALRPGDNFGRSVDLSGDRLLVGAWRADAAGRDSGSAWVMRRGADGWTAEQELAAPGLSAGDGFGWTVALDGDRALVGAYRAAVSGVRTGVVHAYRRGAEGWAHEQVLAPQGGRDGDWFGYHVALDGALALVGANKGGAHRGGAAWVFRRDGPAWAEAARLEASDAERDDAFGFHLDVSGRTGLVGAWRKDREAGAAYVFEGL